MTIEVGKSYKTRGGWRAKIVHIGPQFNCTVIGRDAGFSTTIVAVLAIHYCPDKDHAKHPAMFYKPEEVAYHDEDGKAMPMAAVGVFPPTFGREILHPADLIEEI